MNKGEARRIGRPPLYEKSVNISLHLDHQVVAKVEDLARSQARSTSQMANIMLKQQLDMPCPELIANMGGNVE